MIPERTGDLDTLLAEVERQHHEVDDLFERVPREAALWRPDATRWSMTGHLAHLGITNGKYLGAIEESVRESRASGGPASDGPYRHPPISRWFVRAMEPPPKRRTKTFRAMVPDSGADPAEAVRNFQRLQQELAGLIEDSRGLDLGKIRFGSPFVRLLRFSLGAGFEVVLSHNRRHLWLVRELMDRDDFAGAASEAPGQA